MNTINFYTDELSGKEFAIIDRGNGEFTTMPKADYEAQQASDTLPSNSADPVEKPKK